MINETSSDTSMIIDQATKAVAHVRNQNEIKGVGNGAYIYQQEESGNTKNVIFDIQAALDKGKSRILFQPIVSLQGQDKEFYEVIVHILNEDGDDLSLDTVLKTNGDTEEIDKIDRRVILETFKHLAKHHKENSKTQVFIALNIQSACDDTLAGWLKAVFDASKLPHSKVIFQIKEAAIMQHLTAVKTFVDALHDMGAGFCVSHFGCALNPMNLLEHIDADYIKTDGSFTQEIQDNPTNSEALETLMSQLNEQQKITIIPMVENAGVLSKLWRMRAHYIQGHYLQGPSDKMDYDFSSEG